MTWRQTLNTPLILFALSYLSACSNPLGSSIQTPAYHPGFEDELKLDSVSPATGALQGGTLLRLTGTGFKSSTQIFIGDMACQGITLVSDKILTCLTPAHAAGTVNIEAKSSGSKTSTLAQAFQYVGFSSSVANFAASNVGGIATGTGVRMRFTAGAVGEPVQPSGTGVRLNSGVQGALPHP
jgi:hypothetical protein